MRALLSSPLGFLIGLSLGAVGGGGSILAVPALVYAAGQTPKAATTTSLVIVGLTALSGLRSHARAKRVRWLSGAVFGLAGVGGSLLGSRWNKQADPHVLLLAFSGLMLVAAAAMYRRARAAARAPLPSWPDSAVAVTTRVRIDTVTVVKVALAGSLVGLLTGFFGVGGGFVIVPALVLALAFSMPEAVGTSLLVIGINTAVALALRLRGGTLEWKVIVPYAIAGMCGVLVGARVAGRVDGTVLARWFVRLLVGVAVYTAIRSALAL
jgi:uncharacterized membrane protein YfcA